MNTASAVREGSAITSHARHATDGQRVERVADALPARQAAPAVEPALVDEHRECLRGDRDRDEAEHHRFSNSAPHTVSPGPNARLGISVPRGTPPSSTRRIQMCGSVADDMLP